MAFREFPYNSEDEKFNFLHLQWNVSRLQEYCEQNLKPITKPLSELQPMVDFVNSVIRIHDSYLPKVDLSKPAILVQLGKGGGVLVDGNHRLIQSARTRAENFSFYNVSFEVGAEFLTEKWMHDNVLETLAP